MRHPFLCILRLLGMDLIGREARVEQPALLRGDVPLARWRAARGLRGPRRERDGHGECD